jgi:hypothetical protein
MIGTPNQILLDNDIKKDEMHIYFSSSLMCYMSFPLHSSSFNYWVP